LKELWLKIGIPLVVAFVLIFVDTFFNQKAFMTFIYANRLSHILFIVFFSAMGTLLYQSRKQAKS
jgi:ABC-type transport system involved in cytochrome bd biosynthesis fused ATPase/permease subunit